MHLLKDIYNVGETSLCYEVEVLGSIVQMRKLRLGEHLGNCLHLELGLVLWGCMCPAWRAGHPLSASAPVGCRLRPGCRGDGTTGGRPWWFPPALQSSRKWRQLG